MHGFSQTTANSPATKPFIVAPHGGYMELKAFSKSEAIYLATVMFCNRFLPAHGDRTVDQMVQAARSCKQNLAEGSAASGTSKVTELRLTSVARASLDELLADYLDYLHVHGWEEWPPANPRKTRLRNWCHARNAWTDYEDVLKNSTPDVFCNIMICLIYQVRTLIDGMIRQQDRDLREKGDFNDRVDAARQARRNTRWDDGIYRWLSSSATREILAHREQEVRRQIASIVTRIRERNGWES